MSPESRYDAWKGRSPPQYDEPEQEVDCMDAPLSALLRAVYELSEEDDLVALDMIIHTRGHLLAAKCRAMPLNDEEWAAYQEDLRDSDPRIP